MKCESCLVNKARYITISGLFTCAICPLKTKSDSIRLSDVPALLAWARMIAARTPSCTTSYTESDAAELRAIIGKGTA